MKRSHNSKIAVLIDAHSINSKCVGKILNSIKELGTPIVTRVYEDWTDLNVQEWKRPILENHITPVQQFLYNDRNNNDGTMIIDAMDLLHNDSIDTFCIITNNICYTRLVTRLRENDRNVIGIGRKETNILLKSAFSKFFCVDSLSLSENNSHKPLCNSDGCSCQHLEVPRQQKESGSLEAEYNDEDNEADLIDLICDTISDVCDEEGWAFMADIGNAILRKYPDFNPQEFGFVKLTPLVKSLSDYFEIQEREVEGNERIHHIFVRNIID